MSSRKLNIMMLEDRIVLNASLAGVIADVTSNPSPTDGNLITDVSNLHPAILYVEAHATGKDNGSSWSNAETLQSALAYAKAHSGIVTEILAAKGTYSVGTGKGSTFNLPNNVVILGGFEGVGNVRNPSEYITTFTGARGTSVVTMNGTTDIVDGVNISNANGGTPSMSGGALHESQGNLLLYNMTFNNNRTSYWGGAIDSEHSSLAIFSSTFSNNSATYGGAIEALSDNALYVNYSTFTNNRANFGGAIDPNTVSTLNISSSTFTDNTAAIGYGGAIDPLHVGNTLIQGNTFSYNSASYGGAIQTGSELGPVSIINNQFVQNTASIEGSALQDSSNVPLTITGNSFTHNTGSQRQIWLGGAETSVNGNSARINWLMSLVEDNTLNINDVFIA